MRVLYFNITYRCNSNCLFCAADHPLEQETEEMPLKEFEELLERRQVGAGDRVIVNGGEPTIHRDFFGILDAINICGAQIDLFTNGTLFKDEAFMKHLISYPRIYIRVPLFGGTAETHDQLTGHVGGFDAVCSGLDYIVKHPGNGIWLEIKMLLSRFTVSENEKILDLANRRWKAPHVLLSLNPLLISRCVVNRKDMFIDTYRNLLRDSEPMVQHMVSAGWNYSMDLIPFCAFPDADMMSLCRGQSVLLDHYYADPKGNNCQINEMKERERCMKCRYVWNCNGFPESYIRYFGKEEMKPITI